MESEAWEMACMEDEIKSDQPKALRLGKKNILLVRREGRIYAVGGRCPHYGAPLKNGLVMGYILTCPRHNARFDIRDGSMISPPALNGIAHYRVKVDRGRVYVKKSKPSFRKPGHGKDKRTFVIIGAGAAGISAAITLRKNGFEGRVVMATEESSLPYDKPTLTKGFLSGKVDQRGAALKNDTYYKDAGIEILTEHRVEKLDIKQNEIFFKGGGRLNYHKLLLATGSVPKKLPIKGFGLDGCFMLRTIQDARAVSQALDQAERVVIIGAGFIGLEVAATCRELNKQAALVAPEAVPMANIFGERIGAYIRRLHEHQGAVFYLEDLTEEIKGNSRVEQVVLKSGETIEADMVIMGAGAAPAVGLLENSGLVHQGEVPVDSRLQTGAQDVYAAGDIASVPDHITGERRRVEHWVEAQLQGQHAARCMLGNDKSYREVPFFWSKQHQLTIRYVGSAKTYDRIVYRGEMERNRFIAGYYTGGRLRAVSGAGRSKELIVLTELLKNGKSISPENLADERFAIKL
ncbi:MAG: FAD-dependent oxidoreductase [Spirochaetota bacterium]